MDAPVGASPFTSHFADGDGDQPGLFQERFGTLRVMFEMHGYERGVVGHFVGWSLAGLPLPRWLALRAIRTGAEDAKGLYRFRIVAAHRWLGLLFAYRGALKPASADGTGSGWHLQQARSRPHSGRAALIAEISRRIFLKFASGWSPRAIAID